FLIEFVNNLIDNIRSDSRSHIDDFQDLEPMTIEVVLDLGYFTQLAFVFANALFAVAISTVYVFDSEYLHSYLTLNGINLGKIVTAFRNFVSFLSWLHFNFMIVYQSMIYYLNDFL
ncbi:hypothetical protein L9F63_019899, partial [Diploptera punctata]